MSFRSIKLFSVFIFVVLLIQGSLLGLSDDEAYYWVLAQKLSFGYAYHPPGVAGFIALFQFLLGGIFGYHSPGLVRLPAALSSAAVFGMGLAWLKELGLNSKDEIKAGAVLLSFFGFFSLSWMMVPDIPLFLGWTILFTQCWKLCEGNSSLKNYWGLCLGATLTLLSKYSGVLAVFSAFISLCFWAPRGKVTDCLKFLFFGTFLGVLPSIIWNNSHEWASLLYQIHDRHEGGAVSILRYFRFWGIEVLLVGPWVIVQFFKLLMQPFEQFMRRNQERASIKRDVNNYILAWILPAAIVFCIQPLFSDFKPHWAFIVWWPVILSLALTLRESGWKSAKFHCFYGLTMGALILINCHFPIGSWIFRGFKGATAVIDPRLDITNDFYGWDELEAFIQNKGGSDLRSLPVIGSRYQTAAQAKFGLSGMRVTLLPRDIKEKDEWPDLGVSDRQGPAWPKISERVLFIADNRYSAGPQFPSSECEKIGRFEKKRWHLLAKWIDVWSCIPHKS